MVCPKALLIAPSGPAPQQVAVPSALTAQLWVFHVPTEEKLPGGPAPCWRSRISAE